MSSSITFPELAQTLNIAIRLFFWGVQRILAERAVIIATLEPVIASVLAWVRFGQTLTMMQIIGGVLIIIAVTSLQVIKV